MSWATIEYSDEGGRLTPRFFTFAVDALDVVTGHRLPDELVEAIVEATSPMSICVGDRVYGVMLEASDRMVKVTAEQVGPEEGIDLIRATEKVVENLCQQAQLAAAVFRHLKGE